MKGRYQLAPIASTYQRNETASLARRESWPLSFLTVRNPGRLGSQFVLGTIREGVSGERSISLFLGCRKARREHTERFTPGGKRKRTYLCECSWAVFECP
jgi:hypothetical protein